MSSLFCSKKASLFLRVYTPLALLIRWLHKDPPPKPIPSNPKILLCCWGSLGDVLLACSILPLLQERWPKGSFGFLCETGSVDVLLGQTKLTHIHTAPNWMNCSKKMALFSLLYHTIFSYPRVAARIQALSYDLSIELHPFFPNTLPLARKAKISRRIAFSTGGYDVWMTEPIPFPSSWDYLPLLYPKLLKGLGITSTRLPCSRPLQCAREKIVIHMGTSDPRKEWPLSLWKELILLLRKHNYPLLFTGKGLREKASLSELCSLEENLCNKQDFSSFSRTIQEARALITVDSLSVHLAALFQTPQVALYLYNETVDLWLPPTNNCRLLISENCHFQHKKEGAYYFQETITAKEIFSHLQSLLEEP